MIRTVVRALLSHLARSGVVDFVGIALSNR